MDGTIVDFDSQMQIDLEKMRSPDEPIVDPWDRNYPYMQARKYSIMSQAGWWRNLKPIDGGMNLLNDAVMMGFNVHILTKGPVLRPDAWKEKVEWCQDHLNLKENNIKMTITENKGMVYGKILVDDFPPYVKKWLKNRPRGLVIMPSCDYNKTFEHPNVIKVDYNNTVSVLNALGCMRKVLNRKPGEELLLNE
jgi:5'(3')-deoxyribonucleotidase